MKHILIVFFLISTACASNLSTKTFISPGEWFKFEQPKEWIYEEEEEGTYLFYNNDNWKGSFRITPLRIKGKGSLTINQEFDEYLNEELEKNIGVQKVEIGNKDMIHYSKKILQDGDELQIDYWLFGLDNTLFMCSFTIDFGSDNDEKVKKEIALCHSAFASIELNNK